MRVEVVAIGTELLLGYVIDTNSAWIGDRLASSGLDCLLAVKVGDNRGRIAAAVTASAERADAVICCGGLGPTSDDVTREALAEVMGVELVRDPAAEAAVEEVFTRYGMVMGDSNRRQADVPVGARLIPQRTGTAPGLVCPLPGGKVAYAVPGVPSEMREMVERAVLPDLMARSGASSIIASRTVHTWGVGESAVAEALAGRLAALDAAATAGVPATPAIAFLASAAEGVKVRLTVKVATDPVASRAPADVTATGTGSPAAPAVASAASAASAALDAEEAEVRTVMGPAVVGVDDQVMAVVVGRALAGRGRTLGMAESLTGGLIGARLTDVPGASSWFAGGVVSYASAVKRDVLGIGEGPVVSAEAAEAMAAGVTRLLGTAVGLAVTGVAGPDAQEGQPVGTLWVGSTIDGDVRSQGFTLPGRRADIRSLAVMCALDHLRRRLLDLPPS